MKLKCDNIKLDGVRDVLIYVQDEETGIVLANARMQDNFSKLYWLYTKPGERMKGVIDELIHYAAILSIMHGNKKIYGTCKAELLPMYARYGLRVYDGPDDDGLYKIETDLPDVP